MFALCFGGLDTRAEFRCVPADVAVDNAVPDSLAGVPVVPMGALILSPYDRFLGYLRGQTSAGLG